MSNNYRFARQKQGLSLEEAAFELDVDPDTLRDWENGVSEPFADNLRKMAELYGCSPDYLLGLPEKR